MPQAPVIFLGFANDRVDHARYLRNLPKELDGIRKALFLAEQMGLCELVVRPNLTVDHIISVFQDPRYRDRIAIFHYGGHAHGYQLLLETLDDSNLIGESEGLVPFFARQKSLQLVFLNGCASRPHALELLKAGIPAVIGTAEPINDHVATQLSVRFYKGLGNGLPLERAWAEAEDEVKMSTRKGSYRDLVFDVKQWEKDGEINGLPWELHLREGAEEVKGWSLPLACGNHLFGLDLPSDIRLPEDPFLFFKRYERKDAAVFFGRSAYIRELYNRVADPESPPLILLYGQSGVGKSSLFDSGLRPRLEHKGYAVVYIRRQPDEGLLGALTQALRNVQQERISQQALMSDSIPVKALPISPNLQQLLDTLNQSVQELEEQADPQYHPYLEQLKAMQAHGAGMLQELEQTSSAYEEVQQARQRKAGLLKEKETLLSQWLQIEAQLDQPLVILLDQVEEVFTRPSKDVEELDRFLSHLEQIFGNPDLQPDGRLILAYRKEYHPEIEKGCKTHALPRSQVFLERLKREELIEVVEGLSSTNRLRNRYHLRVEDLLAGEIADDLLADRDSPVAPILQILITKMWNHAKATNSANPEFTIDLYRDLKDEGILLDEFFQQQIDQVAQRMPEAVESGWLLDLLNAYTTPLGTADSRSLESMREFYNHRREELEGLLQQCKDLYLLSDTGNKLRLSHDTLAPLVQRAFRESDAPGQRASRILDNKLLDFDPRDASTTLDPMDLELVEKGERGMRHWGLREQDLVRLSRIRRDREKRNRNLLWGAFVLGMLAIGGLGVYSIFQKQEADTQRNEAVAQKELAVSNRNEADRQRDLADSNRKIAEINEQLADSNRLLAETAKDSAIYQETIARSEALVNQSRLLLRDNDPNALTTAIQARKTFSSDRTHEMLLRVYHHSPVPQTIFESSAEPSSFVSVPDGSSFYIGERVGPKTHHVHQVDRSGRLLTSMSEHSLAINDIDVSDTHVASVAEDKALLIWRRNKPANPQRIRLDAYGVGKFVRFLPDGDRVLVQGNRNWMMYSMREKLLEPFDTLVSAPTALALAPAGDIVVLGYQDGTIELRNLANGHLVPFSEPVNRQEGPVKELSFSSDGSRILGVYGDFVWIQDRHGKQLKKWKADQQAVQTARFFEQDRYVATGGTNKTIQIRDARSGLLLLNLKGHQQEVTGIEVSANGGVLYSSSSDGTIRTWPLERRHQPLFTFTREQKSGADLWGKNGKLILASQNRIGIWNGEHAYQSLGDISADKGLSLLAVSTDQQNLLAVDRQKTLYLWNKSTTIPQTLSMGSEKLDAVYDLDISRRWMVVGARPKALVFRAGGTFHRSFTHVEQGKKKVDVVAIHPNERTLMTLSTQTKTLRIWDISSGNMQAELSLSMSIQDAIILSGNQGILLAGDKDIYRYRVGTSSLTPLNMTHNGAVQALDVSPDGKYLLSASGNDWYLWNLTTKTKLYQHSAHSKTIRDVVFSPDGSYILSTSGDQTVRRWLIGLGEILK
ncbi:MAG: AAA family ATPase [Bacteroidota bacterium]